MRPLLAVLVLMLATIIAARVAVAGEPTAPYPVSAAISGIDFDFSTTIELAPGSDNWAITWGGDGHQYTTWGDGGGFGGTNTKGRVSLGVGRVEGDRDAYLGFNVWGGFEPENPATFVGKSTGMLAIDLTLYLWRAGNGSGASAFSFQELYRSDDLGATWNLTPVDYRPDDFPDSDGPFTFTFLQFGAGYSGARDTFVYAYGAENKDGNWNVQTPGEIALMRAPVASLENPADWEFFAGLDGGDQPQWTQTPGARAPVFEDPVNGVMRTSVSYNAGLERYLLITQQVNRFESDNGHIGIYDAPEPWGPWTTVLFANPWEIGLQDGGKTVYWNFSNKWLSADGRQCVLVYTGSGSDEWGTVSCSFTLPGIFADGFESGDAGAWDAAVP